MQTVRHIARRVRKGIRNLPNLARGYNLYVDREKLDLIARTFTNVRKGADSFADLGAVWKVNAGYTFFTLNNFFITRGYIVDTHFTDVVNRKVAAAGNLTKIQANFGTDDVAKKIGHVDVVFLFDVLLHQVNPHWDEVLRKYSSVTDCFVIFNQQYVKSDTTFRLTGLSLEDYKAIVPMPRHELYEFIYAHKDDLNEEHNRRWIDIPDIFQWAITDPDLRSVLSRLGFKEAYYKNCGPFSSSTEFENHAFIFVKTATSS